MRVLISPSYYKFLNPLNETMIYGSPFLGFNSSLFLVKNEKKLVSFFKNLRLSLKVHIAAFSPSKHC